ncbi:MAG: M55 family metallopeptidase [Planctomycetota bacterium]|nr:M55 family metallopeptidase [Planctomycetota bacterium]
MRVLISVDMEGATGVCHPDHLMPGGQDYEAARRWLTGDVNAAIRGAKAAGATDVLVADGHGTMRNIILEQLDPLARLLTGPAQVRNRPLCQLGALEHGVYDAAFMIGHHTRAGTPGGLLAHTWVGRLVHEIRLNGKPASESWLNAAILGHYGVPVVTASGADEYGRQMREDFGDGFVFAEVKQTLGPTAIVTLSLETAQARIEEAAREGLAKGGEPLVVEKPVVLELELHTDAMRAQALELGGEPVGRLGLRFTADDMVAAAEQLWRALAHTLREDAAFLK